MFQVNKRVVIIVITQFNRKCVFKVMILFTEAKKAIQSYLPLCEKVNRRKKAQPIRRKVAYREMEGQRKSFAVFSIFCK